MLHTFIQNIIQGLANMASGVLLPLMFVAFFIAATVKLLVTFTVRRQWWFAKEFEKRTVRFLEKRGQQDGGSFFVNVKKLLERTFYELFEVRGVMMRRKLDYVTSPIDRLFAIQQGCARFVHDCLAEIRFLRYRESGESPRFLEISKSTSASNPYFGRLFGWVPINAVNDVLNLIPGLFIISGIFGTFLGIMEALPELGNLDIKDPEGSKLIMDTFLLKISFAISASTFGILFSVVLSIIYTLSSPEKIYVKVVDIYDRCLSRLWESSSTNEIPDNLEPFNEQRDPIEALAQMTVEKELRKTGGTRHNDLGGEDPHKKAS